MEKTRSPAEDVVALARERDLLRSVLDTAYSAIVVLDLTGTITKSDTILTLTGSGTINVFGAIRGIPAGSDLVLVARAAINRLDYPALEQKFADACRKFSPPPHA